VSRFRLTQAAGMQAAGHGDPKPVISAEGIASSENGGVTRLTSGRDES